MNKFMQVALEEALNSLKQNEGGPFGAVIVKNDQIISQAHSQVLLLKDPTAHAEMQAIRIACSKLKTFDLAGCEIYSTCYPCPMCLGAIHWARLSKLYYGATPEDAAQIKFDDQKFAQDIQAGKLPKEQIDQDECLVPFEEWANKKDKVQY